MKWRPVVVTALSLLGLSAVAGCGIRSTSVPVDAGAAPSRVSCAVPLSGTSTPATGSAGVQGAQRTQGVQIYLVCAQRVAPVERIIPRLPTDRLATARLLLAELQSKPDAAEENGGFASEVPGGLSVSGPAHGDPADTLRLNQDPDGLPSFAAAQLVCTFAGTAAGSTDHSVVLGGPDDSVPPRRYQCDDAMRTRPDAGATAGTSVS
ncbi:hypothetical protein NGB36_18325 [Streptomyces sp. RB6PN25]|uniref:Lipoprotein n=1 Tax=Streptomyces humicola TaxID=2953240 RepID=A0ABT1PXU9_9ACTN|nr:hypothetical protein [Streptomyces humicola]MCQ4082504.1 hypothetical protein [Streptomyces humicola]